MPLATSPWGKIFSPPDTAFPGYTLMGGRVLRLPFIPETSLPHEIVHNWWGNGVLVDFASGNWCEGLTSYTADYLNKEQASPDAAKDYRRQALRNYASLVSPATNFPLSRFQSRTDPVTKAVGYDKSAMVFHMLRQEIGDAAFWSALRDLYRDSCLNAPHGRICGKFSNGALKDTWGFLFQWIEFPGAPQIRLENVRRETGRQGFRTTGRLVQEKPYYNVSLNLALDTEGGEIDQTVHLSNRQSKFEIPSDTRPRGLTADPDYHLFGNSPPRKYLPRSTPSRVQPPPYW